ncbi:hypothetical protein PTTG_29598 [Puccinia triticina 1-1 BBBD Race 1]|uniref:Uncharacterized protein n=1 Tax=Puccinia triticina (isolate 1-1 / race 1 (BBBD)) TaxID=630390 RepID=A0A180G340_PUCT1|nr:hypothetical protein PTTG_29598 [Puccinia triticina 1-1 BBBD Race 1]
MAGSDTNPTGYQVLCHPMAGTNPTGHQVTQHSMAGTDPTGHQVLHCCVTQCQYRPDRPLSVVSLDGR